MRRIRVAQIGTSEYSHGKDIFRTLAKHPDVFEIVGYALPEGERENFCRWLDDFEHDRLELPRADLVLYLDMPTDFAVKLLRSREQATNTTADIHEVDDGYLSSCRTAALQAAKVLGWTVIPCVQDGRLRSIEEIHQQIWNLVSAVI